MCIGDFDGKALEKLLVNGVQKPLLLGVVAHHRGGAFDCDIKAVKLFEKIIAVEGVRW